MGTVHGVACLEGNNLVPSALSDLIADLSCRAKGIGEIGLEVTQVQYLNITRDQVVAQIVKGGNTWMLRIQSAEDIGRHRLNLFRADFFDRRHIHQRNHRMTFGVGVSQGNTAGAADA